MNPEIIAVPATCSHAPESDAIAGATDRQYLVFEHGGALYAADVAGICQVIPYRPLTDVPGMRGYLRGGLDLDGRPLPVIDLDARLGSHTAAILPTSCIIVVRQGVGDIVVDIGVIADAVWLVASLPDSSIVPPPEACQATGIPLQFVIGQSRCSARPVTIIALDRLVASDPLGGKGIGGCGGREPT